MSRQPVTPDQLDTWIAGAPDSILDLSGFRLDEPYDRRLPPETAGLTLAGLEVTSLFRLRNPVGVKLHAFEVHGLDAGLSMLGGVGWQVSQSSLRGTSSMAQLQIAWDDLFGAITTPTSWAVIDTHFDSQAVDGPPVGATVHQCHNVYVHSIQPVPMVGRFERCTFSNAPYGSNMKLGGTATFTGHCTQVEVVECGFSQPNGGVNVLLPGYSIANRFERCSTFGQPPERKVLHVNGPATAHFERCQFTGRQLVSMSRKMWRSWWGTYYPVWWYAPHTEFHPESAIGRNVEGITFTNA